MEEHGQHAPSGESPTPAPAPFLGVTDLSAGPGTPVDVAALMPASVIGPVGVLGENSTLDLKVARGSATLDLASHAKFAVQKPRRRKGGPRPDLWAGAGKPLDVRTPLPRRGKVYLTDLRAPVRTPLRKAADILAPERTLANAFRKAARLRLREAAATAPRAAAAMMAGATATVLLAALVLGVKATVEHDVAAGYGRLAALASGEGGPFSQAVGDVRFSFRRASLLFAPVSWLADNPAYRNPQVVLAGHALAGGRAVSDALSRAQEAADRILRDVRAGGGPRNVAWTALLEREKPALEGVVADLESALGHYDAIDPDQLPREARERFLKAREALRGAAKWGRFALDNWALGMDALGQSYPVKILVLNQNRDELRPGGGFPGSVGVVDLYRGQVTGFDLKDVYWFDWRLFPYKEPAPEGINRLFNNDGTPVSFALRDANYFPSFLESARKIDFFFQKAGQGSLDAVAGINQGVVVDLLKITGPVYLPEIGRSIGADDFSLAMSLLVEARMYAKASPKDILFRFGEEFARKLEEKGDWGAYAKVVAKHFSEGDMPVAWLRPDVQKGIVDAVRPVDRWKYDEGDWAYPLFTSYSGNKSDRVMDRTITLERDPSDPCLRTLRLEARHTYSAADDAKTRKWMFDLGIADTGKDLARLARIQGAGDNLQYVRLVLPKGARLVASSGTVLRQLPDGPKYSLLDWYQETKAGATTRVTATYRVPAALCPLTPTLYRQPGLTAELTVR